MTFTLLLTAAIAFADRPDIVVAGFDGGDHAAIAVTALPKSR